MYLKKPLWSDALKKADSDAGAGGASPEAERDSPLAVVEELVGLLTKQRVYREVTLALRTGLRDARAEFSFLRVRGLRSLLKFLRSVSESDTTIELFALSQSVRELQVVPVLFQHSLKDAEEGNVASLDHIFAVEPLKITSPSTDAEAALALRVLEGCCLLHTESTILAHQHKAIPVLMNILSTRGVLEQGACLDALISIMLDSSANQTLNRAVESRKLQSS
ncbi:hypothetical protein EUGRSUZ_K00407 [Eucalyptus grandis]|uniref:Uncharacterized protein n=3 Tax=Eucalyptus grandis TaxID=71139 RepID=A0A058ZZT1_EUCGR|nr:hypothetical protein EUGRSUZ_K00407 [Eucalyptus grandis]KAK3404063.1 hypothetical protein EUGRSUZ_K00407 [Eucalyptus grandis]